MRRNRGCTYRDKIDGSSRGQTALGFLASKYRHSTTDAWAERFARGEVVLDGATASGDEVLRVGQELLWNRPPWDEADAPRHYDLLHEDEAIVAVNKPSGLPTLPSGGFLENTLLSVVRERYPEASPLHRLGRGTSGLILFSRNSMAAALLSKAWREREVEKSYRALSRGVAAEDRYEISAPIGLCPHPLLGSVFGAAKDGKPSSSTARVLQRRSDETLFAVDIHTGRPDQIRIHLAFIGHPIVGDELYDVGGVPRAELPALPGDIGYLLHSEFLAFVHPLTGSRMELRAPVPERLRED